MRSVILSAVLSFPILAQIDSANSNGQIQGTVVDTTGAGVRAMIRMLQQPTGPAILRFNTTDTGAFQTDPLPAGVYSLIFISPGFRRRELRSVVIEAGRTTALGEIRLDLSGCDTPGTNCDYFGAVPNSVKRIIAEANVVLALRCAVDLDRQGEPICPSRDRVKRTPNADIRLVRENAILYLVPENSAAISTAEPPTSDCSLVTYRNHRLAVAGLGVGVDFCVRTNRGSISHVFSPMISKTKAPQSRSGMLHAFARSRSEHGTCMRPTHSPSLGFLRIESPRAPSARPAVPKVRTVERA